MKRLLVAALLSLALLGGTRTAAQAGEFGIGLGITLTFTGSKSCAGSGDNGNCSSCKGCLPHPCWSGSYPQPTMYGGLFASMPCQDSYPPPYPMPVAPNYGYPPFQGNYGGYNQGYGWMQPRPALAPATPGISTVPPPSPSAEPSK
jgi:hypothetical protein